MVPVNGEIGAINGTKPVGAGRPGPVELLGPFAPWDVPDEVSGYGGILSGEDPADGNDGGPGGLSPFPAGGDGG